MAAAGRHTAFDGVLGRARAPLSPLHSQFRVEREIGSGR